jgi:hypothetical protein
MMLRLKMKMKRSMTLKDNLVVGTKNIQIMEDLGVVGKKHKLVEGWVLDKLVVCTCQAYV